MKDIGVDQVLYDDCVGRSPETGIACERSSAYAGRFSIHDYPRFSIIQMYQQDNRNILAIAKGRCSKL